MFVCPKCGRGHTKTEISESRFCQKCGKFLSLHHRIPIAFEKKQLNPKWPLFPYQPYPQQVEFMRDIKNVLSSHGILVAEACNGFGKTMCALATVLSFSRKIVYITRTHEQVLQVLMELERINRFSGKTFTAVNLASRRHLCLNKQCRDSRVFETNETCRLLRASGQCSFKTDFNASRFRFPSILSIKQLRNQGIEKGICPYFLARHSVESSNVIVAPYQYVFNEHIRKQIKLTLSDKLLIFDEAHNADKIGQEVLSDTISERVLASAISELKSIGGSTKTISRLLRYVVSTVMKKPIVRSGINFQSELEDVLKSNFSTLIQTLSRFVETIRSKKIENGEFPLCYLNGILKFFERVANSPGESYVAIYRFSFTGSRLIEYRCLDPSLAIKPVVHEALGSLVMSGTLSPIALFTEILGLDAKTRSYSAIADPENVRTIIDSTVTTRYTERSDVMIRRYGHRIVEYVQKIPNGVLLFFTQRKLMLNFLDTWQRAKIIQKIGSSLWLGGKSVFVEGSGALENRRIVSVYKTEARRKGGVLCGVFRGRNSEGSNFPYDEARGVILVGVPFANYNDPFVKVQINYFNRKSNGMGNKWYVMDAMRAANQAIGRGIRHRDDWCNFILMDYRYNQNKQLLSSWVVERIYQSTK